MSHPSSYQARRLEHIQLLFETHRHLFEHVDYPEMVTIQHKGAARVRATLPLKDHQVYGETVLTISEKLNEDGVISEYHYGWERSLRNKKMGKHLRHILAFGNEWKEEGTPAWVETNPYHHHHVPEEPRKRKSTKVQDLESVISILTDYIHSQLTYDESDEF